MSRYLGQHFLINKDKIKKIVEALDLKEGDTVIEIGPGHGELTLLLARNFQFPSKMHRNRTILSVFYPCSVGYSVLDIGYSSQLPVR